MLVWARTLPSDPATNCYPGNDDVGPDPGAFAGHQIELDGTVTKIDPVIIEIDDGFDEPRQITFEGVDDPVSEGQQISAFDSLTDESTLAVDRAIVRSP